MPANESKSSQRQGDVAKKLTDRLLIYQNFRPDQYPEYVAAFKRMLSEFDEKRVNEGLTAAIDNCPDFLPNPAKIRQYIPRPQQGRPTCPRCVDSEGWIDAGRDKAGNRAVRLCDHAA